MNIKSIEQQTMISYIKGGRYGLKVDCPDLPNRRVIRDDTSLDEEIKQFLLNEELYQKALIKYNADKEEYRREMMRIDDLLRDDLERLYDTAKHDKSKLMYELAKDRVHKQCVVLDYYELVIEYERIVTQINIIDKINLKE